jgi:hypothetical protein
MFRPTARRLALAVTVIAAAAALAIAALSNPAAAQPHHSPVYKDSCPTNGAYAYSPLMQSDDRSSVPKK